MEIWKPVPGLEGRYEVSDAGRLRSIPHMTKTKGNGQRLVPGKILALSKCNTGYLIVNLGKDHKNIHVHRMVAKVFLSPPDFENAEVNHKNLIKTDNRVENLEWVTKLDNMRHAHKNGAVDYDAFRKPIRNNLGMEFQSSYAAAEWVNATAYGYKGNVTNIASNIRRSIRKKQMSYGFKWSHVEKQPSTTIPKGSTPKRVEMGGPS